MVGTLQVVIFRMLYAGFFQPRIRTELSGARVQSSSSCKRSFLVLLSSRCRLAILGVGFLQSMYALDAADGQSGGTELVINNLIQALLGRVHDATDTFFF